MFRSLNPEWQRWVLGVAKYGKAVDPREADRSLGERDRAPWNGFTLREEPKRGAHALESIVVSATSSKLSLALTWVLSGDNNLCFRRKHFL